MPENLGETSDFQIYGRFSGARNVTRTFTIFIRSFGAKSTIQFLGHIVDQERGEEQKDRRASKLMSFIRACSGRCAGRWKSSRAVPPSLWKVGIESHPLSNAHPRSDPM